MNGPASLQICTAFVAALCALLGAGCGHTPAPVPRTAAAGGAAVVPQRGTAPVFVSPSSYEGFIRGELQAARGAHARAIESYRAAIDLGDSDPYLIAKLA